MLWELSQMSGYSGFLIRMVKNICSKEGFIYAEILLKIMLF